LSGFRVRSKDVVDVLKDLPQPTAPTPVKDRPLLNLIRMSLKAGCPKGCQDNRTC
jgi:hypothetical protein